MELMLDLLRRVYTIRIKQILKANIIRQEVALGRGIKISVKTS